MLFYQYRPLDQLNTIFHPFVAIITYGNIPEFLHSLSIFIC